MTVSSSEYYSNVLKFTKFNNAVPNNKYIITISFGYG